MKQDMTFEEKELSILRKAVDNITSKQGKKIMNSPEISKIIDEDTEIIHSTEI